MRVLVTGAAGFVGRALCPVLVARGDTVRALMAPGDSAVAAQRVAGSGAELVDGDLGAEADLERAARGCEVLVHAAQSKPHGGTLREHERANVIATENALASARRAGVRRFVFVSTEAVTGGNQPRDYVDESFPHASEFLSPYAETMALAEALVQAENGAHGMATVVVRPGWLWGPDDDVNLPYWLRSARDKRLMVVGDGRAMAPTAYVDNVVSGVALATAAGPAGAVYYVTDDERIGVKMFLQRVVVACGGSFPRRSLPYPLAYGLALLAEKTSRHPWLTRDEVARYGRTSLFNLGLARSALGYEPKVSITEGIKRLSAWANAVGGRERVMTGEVLEPAG